MPEPATRQAVERLDLPAAARVHLIAIGKGAHAMAAGAVAALDARALPLVGGVIVAPADAAPLHASIRVLVGDHPVPGAGSAAAAAAIADAVAAVRAGDHVLALISGGGTSLASAPAVDAAAVGVSQDDLARLSELLLGSGADIVAMNLVRKRVSRWFGGRLAVALAAARVHAFIVSDVLGDDLASISSGPCVPDPRTGADVVVALRRAGILDALPDAIRDYLDAVVAGRLAETPKPGDPAFAAVTTEIIVSNAHATAAAADTARRAGIDEVIVMTTPLVGEAAICGVRLASDLIARRKRQRGPRRSICVVWGGETTVTLGAAPGLGGRSQELALAAARSLADAGEQGEGILLLAAGTDGRDGPTDAAGAIVDGMTWGAVAASGRDPASDLAAHDAYPALDAARALLRVGHTGTNVMDVVIGLVG